MKDNIVQVYWNSRLKKWSVCSNNRVLDYWKNFGLFYCTFKVSEAGRLRVLAKQQKNVHAKIVGELGVLELPPKSLKQVRYNPYEHLTFVIKDSGEPIYNAKYVEFRENGTVFAGE